MVATRGQRAFAVRLAKVAPEPPQSIEEREAGLAAAHAEYQREQAWDGTLEAPPKVSFATRAGRCYALGVSVAPEAVWSREARQQVIFRFDRTAHDPTLRRQAAPPKFLPRSTRTLFTEFQCATAAHAVNLSVHFQPESGTETMDTGAARFAVYSRDPKPGEIEELAAAAKKAGQELRGRMCSECWRVAKRSCAVPLALCNPYLLCLRSWSLTFDYCK